MDAWREYFEARRQTQLYYTGLLEDMMRAPGPYGEPWLDDAVKAAFEVKGPDYLIRILPALAKEGSDGVSTLLRGLLDHAGPEHFGRLVDFPAKLLSRTDRDRLMWTFYRIGDPRASHRIVARIRCITDLDHDSDFGAWATWWNELK